MHSSWKRGHYFLFLVYVIITTDHMPKGLSILIYYITVRYRKCLSHTVRSSAYSCVCMKAAVLWTLGKPGYTCLVCCLTYMAWSRMVLKVEWYSVNYDEPAVYQNCHLSIFPSGTCVMKERWQLAVNLIMTALSLEFLCCMIQLSYLVGGNAHYIQ